MYSLQQVIEDRKRRYLNGEKADDSSRYKSLLEVLLKLHIEDKALDEEGVVQEVVTFIIAGHDTVATTIKWALYLIGLHPEVQREDSPRSGQRARRRRRETAFGGRSQRSQVSGLRFEGGYTIPKGASAIVMTYFLHRDEDVFLIRRNLIQKGRWFGEMEVKTMVCYILRTFSLHSLDSRDKNVTCHEHNSPVVSARSHQVSTEMQQQQQVTTSIFLFLSSIDSTAHGWPSHSEELFPTQSLSLRLIFQLVALKIVRYTSSWAEA
ncbi:cytochrome P450 4C1 [Caerostris extrusa]|uniref:Cytochrome P450 4C1 n=1 Tax=Caerostris extrusa TaxID=172846 RepID=A0AAV4V5D7_CAEEX|nr:cytochrome P450 4C1 [Caerostris extrusa]